MNAKTDGWESYTDEAGRRHWRWPAAADRQMGAGSPLAETDPGKRSACRDSSRRSARRCR